MLRGHFSRLWRDADDRAQRVLGNIEPWPGESIEEYHAALERAEERFCRAYPIWKARHA